MMVRSIGGVGGSGPVGGANLRPIEWTTQVTRLEGAPNGVTNVGLIGRPSLYHVPSSERELIEVLRGSMTEKKNIQVRVDPNNLRILSAEG